MRIIGLGIAGPNEASKYMRKTMEEFKRLCDDAIIVTCNAGEEEKALIAEYGFKTYEDNREWGLQQPNMKTDLVTKAGELNPDWIVWLDMDETFGPEFTREEAEKLVAQQPDEVAFNFMIVNLYNDEQHFAHDAGIQRFWNVRFYKYLPQVGLQFQRTNVHCGAGPIILLRCAWYAPYYVLHYGLMKEEDRLRRVTRYNQYDSKKPMKPAYYEDLSKTLKMHVFDPEGLINKIKASQEGKPRKTPQEIVDLSQ